MLNIGVALLFFFILLAKDLPGLGICIGIFSFSVQYYKAKRFDRFYINHIKLNNDTFEIDYTDISTLKTISGSSTDFIIKKASQWTFSNVSLPCIRIYYNGDLIIQQFCIGEWDTKKLDQVLLFYNGKPDNLLMHKFKTSFED